MLDGVVSDGRRWGGGRESLLKVEFLFEQGLVIVESEGRVGLRVLGGHGVGGGPTQSTGDRRGRGGEGRGGVRGEGTRGVLMSCMAVVE